MAPRRAVLAAVAQGVLIRHARGVFALPEAPPERIQAAKHHGVISHLSAAALHGGNLAHAPTRVHVTVPRGRRDRMPSFLRTRRTTVLHYAELTEDEHRTGVTGPVRTVIDCARTLPFPEALAVADSALRAGAVTSAGLIEAADRLSGPWHHVFHDADWVATVIQSTLGLPEPGTT